MVSAIDGDETLWMFGGKVDLRNVIYADCLISRRMQHQQRAPQVSDPPALILPTQTVKQRLAHHHWPPPQRHKGTAVLFNLQKGRWRELLEKMSDVEWRRNCSYRTYARDMRCGGERGGAAETMAKDELRREPFCLHRYAGRDEILHIEFESGIGKHTFALAQTCEIESQNADPDPGKPTGYPDSGLVVLATAEAVREQCPGMGGARWKLQASCQTDAT